MKGIGRIQKGIFERICGKGDVSCRLHLERVGVPTG